VNLELCAKHVKPDLILDIGANCGYWALEAKKVWPDTGFYLVEANPECESALSKLGMSYLIAVLSDRQKEVDFYTLKDCETATGASYFYNEDYKVNVKTVTTTTLDDVIGEIKGDVLVKIDTQGSELDIMRGGKRVMSKVSSVILEVSYEEYNEGAPTWEEVNSYMSDLGFEVVETVGQNVHPITRKHIQSDILWKRI